jgi:hypothetical protein
LFVNFSFLFRFSSAGRSFPVPENFLKFGRFLFAAFRVVGHPFGGFPFASPDVIFDALDARLPGAVGAAEKRFFGLDAVTDNLAAAVRADRREAVDRALETIENVPVAGRNHLKGQVIIVAADLASRHRPIPPRFQNCRFLQS